MNYWLQSYGTLIIKDGTIRLVTGYDFIHYYKTFVDKHFKMFTHTPAHGSHITIHNPKLHGVLDETKSKFLWNYYKGKQISFEYNPDIQVGGLTTGRFLNFYMLVRCMEIENICKHLGTNQHKNLHITISNTKSGIRPYIWY
jgi:hypothetical protein